jgi:colanic acid/amylovoran biosynthesis glycosyltransferase
MMAKRLIGIPFSMTLNANIEVWGGAMKEKFEDADFTIAITRWLLAQLRRDYPSLAPQQALLGSIGVDTRKWVRNGRPKGHGERPTNLLCVARVAYGKGHDTLLKAVKLLVDGGADVRLDVIGDGPLRQDLEAQASADGLAKRVTFHGSLGELEIIEKMHDADIFVLASISEPLGVAYMEAMAMEVATIGTAAGGVGEIITHDENGVLVPPQNPPALASAIRGLIEDSDRRERLARAGRRSIVQHFDSRLGARTLFERIFGHPPPDGLSA